MKNFYIKQFLLPDVENLAKKDSDVSTKRYAHLRVVNHFITQSWVTLGCIIGFKQWEAINIHLIVIGAFAFANGALALDFLKNFKNKEQEVNNDKSV